ncbi:hypothetical protein IEQ34_026889 [Dendrobium chrysotoxum]|uniref:Uncharacterized protein n=1 Tax=Dendrobium chrysotoxum TaxID=161865 RepID=A0AAV7FKY0_DENCH|nr:hypothetical protein IEQ34_026889 [Dendrobium chrysotoxum]
MDCSRSDWPQESFHAVNSFGILASSYENDGGEEAELYGVGRSIAVALSQPPVYQYSTRKLFHLSFPSREIIALICQYILVILASGWILVCRCVSLSDCAAPRTIIDLGRRGRRAKCVVILDEAMNSSILKKLGASRHRLGGTCNILRSGLADDVMDLMTTFRSAPYSWYLRHLKIWRIGHGTGDSSSLHHPHHYCHLGHHLSHFLIQLRDFPVLSPHMTSHISLHFCERDILVSKGILLSLFFSFFLRRAAASTSGGPSLIATPLHLPRRRLLPIVSIFTVVIIDLTVDVGVPHHIDNFHCHDIIYFVLIFHIFFTLPLLALGSPSGGATESPVLNPARRL